jgi:hypothetical protein
MKPNLLRFQAHIEQAHNYWRQYLNVGDIAIDATCGNGHDTLMLCQLALSDISGHVYAYDIQENAVINTQERLQKALSAAQLARVSLIHECHSNFSAVTSKQNNPVRLVVYNLGYLPGADKSQTTKTASTLQSVQSACNIITSGGLITITCYPGHDEGAIEEEVLLTFASELPKDQWSCCHHRWINRLRAPSLLLLQKR